ncbi:HK97 family phage portal protein [Paraburkholderia sp. JPY465]|uniref:phage portal protein n=1 Tax=Paraburkholderia sp. JPY465 TaxID=3042285 RepID=UPI003D19FFE9
MTTPNNTGSTILTRWRAERESQRNVAAQTARAIPVSEITAGSEGYGWMTGGLPGHRTVSERTAMAVGAVYACVSLIGGALGQLLLQTYTLSGDLATPIKGDLWYLLNEEMHPRWSAALGWEFGAQSLLLEGNMHIRIHRPTPFSVQVESLEPLHPRSVTPMLYENRLIYTIVNLDGTVETVDQDDMLHVPGPGFDGLRGMSQIRHVLRQPVSTALAANDVAENMLTEGLRPDIVLETDAKVDRDQVDRIRTQWRERYNGLANSNMPVVLGGGLKAQKIAMSAADAQLVEREKLTVDDVARIFGVPPYMIGQLEKQTSFGSGIEQMGIGFVRYTLARHMTKIQQEAQRKLATRGKSLITYDPTALLKGDAKSRNDAYRSALGRAGEPGWVTQNEVRKQENLPPVPGGDKLFNGKDDGGTDPQTA